MNALALLQAAISLLTLLNSATAPIPDELRIQALSVANHAVVVANAEIARLDRDEERYNEDNDMNENNDSVGAGDSEVAAPEVALGSFKITSPFKEQGLGREYKAITDDSIERWDQAPIESFVVVGIEVYNADGGRERKVDVRVEASDDSQSRDLDGKTQYQYLFKTKGTHTLTFKADGVEDKVITLNAD